MSFEFPVRVYWEDTDAGGIVFYANYLKFFERARTEWLRHLGIEQQALREATGGMFVVVETQLKYHKPAQLDDLLTVNASLLSKGRSSLVITNKLGDPPTRLCCCAKVRFALAGCKLPALSPTAFPLPFWCV